MKQEISILGLLATGLVVAGGTFWAFERGGKDFDVFFQAWRLVLNGHGAEVYQVSPDRFLYAPGFAWLLAPLAWLPRDSALALWCLAKAAVLGLVLRHFGARLYKDPVIAMGVGGFGLLLLARPFLIDFQYGQVNTFILGVSVWALLRHFRNTPDTSREAAWDQVSWGLVAICGVVKIFPLPLLLVPLLARAHQSKSRLKNEWLGIGGGLTLILLLPVVGVGFEGSLRLYQEWMQALLLKGFPHESHNQSFAAFVFHYLSGEPTPVISEGGRLIPFGFDILSRGVIRVLSLLWTGLAGLAILFWLSRGHLKRAPLEWMAVLIALLILPSHLVWKPYFVMGLPVALLLVQRWTFCAGRQAVEGWLLYAFFFAWINLTGFDVLGHAVGARFEAGAVLLWGHLGLLAATLRWLPLSRRV